MITLSQFRQIKYQKAIGNNRNKASKNIKICFNTVDKYWDLPLQSFIHLKGSAIEQTTHHSQTLSSYEVEIKDLLSQYPELSGNQVWSILNKNHQNFDFSSRTITSYVSKIRRLFNIDKPILRTGN